MPTREQDTDLRALERSYEAISPFEFKNKLISLAEEEQKKSTRTLLNAGRGNPNWIAATPREAFFTLGHFAVTESRRVWDEDDLAGKPEKKGGASRLRDYLAAHPDAPGAALLSRIVDYGVKVRGFEPDEWVHELVDGIIGDNYPSPDRMLTHVEQVVHEYILQEMCEGDESCGAFDLFAVEGATAAMCYLFDSLRENYLLTRHDKIAIMVPIFPPYVEIPELARYDFEVVEIRATGLTENGNHSWQYPPDELEKLADPSIKALFLVNPSNPPSVALDEQGVHYLVDLVKHKRQDLIIITDDVYGTFVDGFRSLLADLPHNTVCVYSFSKYFGVTGWRLGVVAVHKDNVLDRLLKELPAASKEILQHRYASLSQHPESLLFIDRLVADSRQVALNHTAGLSTPQQVQMALFCVFNILDQKQAYKQLTKQICHRRMELLYGGLNLPLPKLPNDADYYTQFDLAMWAKQNYGDAFVNYLTDHYEPVDILFRLAQKSAIVLLNGGGFRGPTWSIRVSLANLDDGAYAQIGHALRQTLDEYVLEWRGETDRNHP